MSGSAPNFPLQKSLSRRVSFNESSLRHRHDSDTESQIEGRHWGSFCSTFCFWASLVLGLLLFVLIIIGSMYYAFLRSNIPDVRLQHLDVFKIDVVSNSTDTLLSAEFVAILNATNQNGKAELVYSAMTARLSSAGIDLGKFNMEEVIEPPLSTTALRVPATITNLTVEEAAGRELQDIASVRKLVIDLYVKGRIGVFVGGKRIIGFPFKIECVRIDQTEIEAGHAPRCISQMTTPLR